ncbi:MAG: peptide chain release factor N(5)-glutamine methyltransferase [Pseudarcicella sp.]|nr:peptide chain release factor N(5)-glutamine methyltransferase [Pseudarcicella sp.]
MKSAKSIYQEIFQAIAQIYDKNEADGIIKLILWHYYKLDTVDFMLDKTTSLDVDLNSIITDLQAFKPIQYIMGNTEFYGLNFELNEATLIPRPETEELVEASLSIINELFTTSKTPLRVVDLGTGSGCIAISIAQKAKDKVNVWAVDIAKNALMIAQKNAFENHAKVNFVEADILHLEQKSFENISKWDIIVSNPPYVRQSEKEVMHKNVLHHEPHLALFVDNANPLIFYKAIVDFALKNLSENGFCMVEINEALGEETAELFTKQGFKTQIVKDFHGKDRFIHAQFKP